MAGKRVLVVDDEKLIVKGIRFSLEQDNMEVDCAYDGEEAPVSLVKNIPALLRRGACLNRRIIVNPGR